MFKLKNVLNKKEVSGFYLSPGFYISPVFRYIGVFCRFKLEGIEGAEGADGKTKV
jgi:hypothetical protein